jgi:hypothetical protein
MPTAENIQQFLLGVVLPIVVGAVTTWLLATVHIFNLFGITEGQISGELTLLGTWGIATAIAALHAHHVLAAHYTPEAKVAAGR